MIRRQIYHNVIITNCSSPVQAVSFYKTMRQYNDDGQNCRKMLSNGGEESDFSLLQLHLCKSAASNEYRTGNKMQLCIKANLAWISLFHTDHTEGEVEHFALL